MYRESSSPSHRIVIYGPPLSGKATIVRRFAQSVSKKAVERRVALGSPPHEYWTARTTSQTGDVEIYTIPGATWGFSPWWELIDGAAGLVLIWDLQKTQARANVHFAEALIGRSHPPIVCIIGTKADLLEIETAKPASCYEFPEELASYPRFLSRSDAFNSLEAPVHWAVDKFLSQVTNDD